MQGGASPPQPTVAEWTQIACLKVRKECLEQRLQNWEHCFSMCAEQLINSDTISNDFVKANADLRAKLADMGMDLDPSRRFDAVVPALPTSAILQAVFDEIARDRRSNIDAETASLPSSTGLASSKPSLQGLDCTPVSGARVTLAANSEPQSQVRVTNTVPPRGTRTLVVRNIPARYSQDSLMKIFHLRVGSFDFLHLPYSKEKKRICGYVFINFTSYEAMLAFYTAWQGAVLPGGESGNVLNITAAEIQGKTQHLIHLRKRNFAKLVDPRLLPLVYEGTTRQDFKICLAATPSEGDASAGPRPMQATAGNVQAIRDQISMIRSQMNRTADAVEKRRLSEVLASAAQDLEYAEAFQARG